MRRTSWPRRIFDLLLIVAVTIVALTPILWGLSTSLKPANRILEYPPRLIPETPTLEHYARLFETGILKYLFNSLTISAATILLTLAIGFVAAYGLARFRFFGRRILLLSIIVIMSIPMEALLVPTFSLFAKWGLVDTRLSLVLLYTAYQLPLSIWILFGHFQSLPIELERAAMVDGYSRFALMRKIVLPLSGAAMVAVGLFAFTFAWNDFVVALVMTTTDSIRTLPIGIYNYLGFYGREWGPLTAAAMFSIVPVVLLFIRFQRYFLAGVTSGSVKG